MNTAIHIICIHKLHCIYIHHTKPCLNNTADVNKEGEGNSKHLNTSYNQRFTCIDMIVVYKYLPMVLAKSACLLPQMYHQYQSHQILHCYIGQLSLTNPQPRTKKNMFFFWIRLFRNNVRKTCLGAPTCFTPDFYLFVMTIKLL